MDLAMGVQLDGYVVEARIRSSALAAVYRLRHVEHGTLHVLKVLYLDHPTLQDRILASGDVQVRLRHDNVVAFTGVLDVGGNPGLLTEFVPGPSLDRVIARGRLDLRLVEQLVPGMLAGVAAAHAVNIVHRDLKPANILLDLRQGTAVPKVADFGLASLLGAHRTGITASGATLTTPNYMAPEQVRDARMADARSDVFALGAILYELVTGERAFDNDNVFSTLSDITQGRWVPVRERRSETPARIVEAIGAALELDPDDRAHSCEELWSIWAGSGAVDLARAARQPVVAAPRWLEEVSGLDQATLSGLHPALPATERVATAERIAVFGALGLLVAVLLGLASQLAGCRPLAPIDGIPSIFLGVRQPRSSLGTEPRSEDAPRRWPSGRTACGHSIVTTTDG